MRSLSTTPHAHARPRGRTAAIGAGVIGAALIALGVWYFPSPEKTLSPDRFIPLKILSVTSLTKDTSLFKLALPKSLLAASSTPPVGPIGSLYLMQPDLQIQRPYTPLSATSFDPKGPGVVDLVVKRYEDGELSRWMHRLHPGDEVRVRGPVVTWDPRDGLYDEIVFIVGGTGITPAYQFIDHTFNSADSRGPKISLIYSSPSPADILLKSSLDALASKYPSRLSVRYLVDRLDPGVKVVPGQIVGRVHQKLLAEWIGHGGDDKRRVVVVCGPEGMINVIAGPRARDLSQGPVAGILGELGFRSSEVVKL